MLQNKQRGVLQTWVRRAQQPDLARAASMLAKLILTIIRVFSTLPATET